MSRTDQALEAARKVSDDDAEYFRAATGLLESLCRELEGARTEARRNGWQLVPIEPTPAMIDAAGHACDGLNLSDLDKIGKSQAKAWYRWRDMLAAAPSVESPQREKP